MNRLMIYIIIIFFLSSCVDHSYQYEYLENEIEKVFPNRNYNDCIVGENKKILEEIDDANLYFNALYDLLKIKVIAHKYFPDHEEFSYKFSEIMNRIADYIHDKENNNKNIILKILIEINNKPDVDYVKLLTGLYKGYYNLLTRIKNDVTQENIKAFINSLPNLKMLILSEYIALRFFKQKPNVKAFYNAYKEVNEQNYEQIFLSKNLFPLLTNKEREEQVDSISYYFKLQQFIE